MDVSHNGDSESEVALIEEIEESKIVIDISCPLPREYDNSSGCTPPRRCRWERLLERIERRGER